MNGQAHAEVVVELTATCPVSEFIIFDDYKILKFIDDTFDALRYTQINSHTNNSGVCLDLLIFRQQNFVLLTILRWRQIFITMSIVLMKL